MERTLTYHIRETEAGLRIEQFLRRKGYSAQNLTQIKQMPESVLVNGSFCYLRHTLAAGDELRIHIQETESSRQILPVQLPLNIVYEDEDLLVVNKPAGMPIHPSLNNYTNFIFRCCNRLDRDTSGLTVVAKHLVSASILSSMTKRKEICREYLAVARGHVIPESGTITAPLARREGTIIERVVDWEKGEPAVTHYQVVTVRNGHSLVALRLETGRTHQIRIHMKYLGYPLIGDYLYNPDMEHITRQALHSHRLSFPHPITGEAMRFEAQLPEDMNRIFL